jgi:hypothetical protein
MRPDVFARRYREVSGFEFNNVPRAPVLRAPSLPSVVPTLYHDSSRSVPFAASAVCLPLYKIIERHRGAVRYRNAEELARAFAFLPGAIVILTGTDRDAPLERWWSLGPERRTAIRALRQLGITLATTPNYSLFTNQPRWEDLYSMKRIAITHEEFLRERVLAALHVNARTDKDWDRWSQYIAARPEITHIAFEFGTGAGHPQRIGWYAAQLCKLARAVERPLHLVVRGGLKVLPALFAGFAAVTLLETSVFMRTVYRQRAVPSGPGKVSWESSPTERDGSIDTLLAANWNAVATAYAPLFQGRR